MNPLYKISLTCIVLAFISLYLSHESCRKLSIRKEANNEIVKQMKTDETNGGGLTFEQQAAFDEQYKELDAKYGSEFKLEQQERTYRWVCILMITIGVVLGIAGVKDNRQKSAETRQETA